MKKTEIEKRSYDANEAKRELSEVSATVAALEEDFARRPTPETRAALSEARDAADRARIRVHEAERALETAQEAEAATATGKAEAELRDLEAECDESRVADVLDAVRPRIAEIARELSKLDAQIEAASRARHEAMQRARAYARAHHLTSGVASCPFGASCIGESMPSQACGTCPLRRPTAQSLLEEALS